MKTYFESKLHRSWLKIFEKFFKLFSYFLNQSVIVNYISIHYYPYCVTELNFVMIFKREFRNFREEIYPYVTASYESNVPDFLI